MSKSAGRINVIGHEEWLKADLPTDKLVACEYWPDGEHWVFDPWASRDGANNIHEHCHTVWAKNIHDSWDYRRSFPYEPARFNWHGKTIFIVGRGASLAESVPLLNERPEGSIAIFLNHACMAEGVKVRPTDYVMCMDPAILKTIGINAKGKQLIGCVTLGSEVLALPWAERTGFTLWPSAPMNNWMRELFPDFTALNECLGIGVSALHLAAVCGASRAVLVGQDCSDDNGELRAEVDGQAVRTTKYYAQLAQAVGCMAYYCFKRADMVTVNTSKCNLVGYNLIDTTLGRMPWVKSESLENIVRM